MEAEGEEEQETPNLEETETPASDNTTEKEPSLATTATKCVWNHLGYKFQFII